MTMANLPGSGVGSDELAEIAATLDPSAVASAAPLVQAASDGPSWSQFVDGWELFRDAVYAAGIAGAVLGFLSVYVVLRRMVFVSAAITQGAGLGVALAFYVGIRFGWSVGPSTGATLIAFAIAAIASRDWQRIRMSREMLLGLAFALAAGLAVVVSSKITQEAHDIQSILFGTAVVVSPEDLHALVAIAIGVMALQVWWYRGFTFASFDPLTARVHGVPVGLLDLVLLVSIALVVARVASTLGALPAFALSTMPGVAAAMISRGPLLVTFAVATAIGASAGVGGYLIAFFWELPVGATQTVTVTAAVVAAALVRAALSFAVRATTAASSSFRRGVPRPGPERSP
jgi:zinc transport system permease protein